jgi:DNA-binding GntR family transcriptional regulator
MPIPQASGVGEVPRQLVRERVHLTIREAILSGVLTPGERLEEAALRGWLGVSATPIRQALHALVIEGLVESAPQSHTTVAMPRADRVVANLQTLGVMITGVSALTVPVLTEDDRVALAELAGTVADRLADGDAIAAAAVSGDYFRRLVERCPNPVLVGLIQRFGVPLGHHAFSARDGLGPAAAELEPAYRELQAAMSTDDADGVDRATRRAFLLSGADHSSGGGDPS